MRPRLLPGLLAALLGSVVLPSTGVAHAAVALPEPPPVTVRGSGWGHSVGMSQYGARAMAIAGHPFDAILRHYYSGVDVGPAGALPAGTETRVHLFAGRPAQAAERLELATASRLGGTPSNRVRVALEPGAPAVALPPGETWHLHQDGPTYYLRSADGTERGRGPGPVVVDYAPAPGEPDPALLRLPQLGTEGAAGTFQWGYLRVTRTDGQWHPVMALPLELYLRGLAEVPSSWQMEALKAQAVAGRTYVTRQIAADPGAAWHLGATPLWQVYAGWQKEGGPSGDRWVVAVDATREHVVTHQGQLAWTYYSSSHGGRSEHSEDSWAYSAALPYLRSVDDRWSLDPAAGNPYASWSQPVDNALLGSVVGLAAVAGARVVSRTPGGSPRELAVWGWDGSGAKVSRSFAGAKGAGAALRNPAGLRSMQISSFSISPFADDDGSTHEFNIWVLSSEGIARGCATGRFCPNDPVTRGQMATFLANALELRVDAGAPDRFGDVAGSVHRAAINAVAAEGITAGCGEGRYCPNDPVTRAQMATFLVRAFGLDETLREHFTDTLTSVHRRAINAVAEAGVTGGCGGTRYCPGAAVTRGQMASFLARALGTGW